MKTSFSPVLKSEIRETVWLSTPLIGSWLIYSLSAFIATAMVARLGHDALAASVITNMLWTTVSVFFFGAFSSLSVIVAHLYGSKNNEAISQVMGQAFLLAVISLVLITLLFWALPYGLRFIPQSAEVESLAVIYANALLWSIPGVVMLVVLENFLNGIGLTKLSLWISLLEVPIEILLIYIFVFGKCGLPAFGIAGVGYGLALSFTLTTIILLIYLHYAKFMQPFKIFSDIGRFRPKYFKELISLGMPIGVMYLIEVAGLAAATFMMAHFATTVLAAHQIIIQYLSLTINASFAISQAVSIRIGQCMGRRDGARVCYASYVGMVFSFLCMLLFATLYIFFPRFLLGIDVDVSLSKNVPLVKEAVSMLAILAIFQLFDSIRIVEAGALRGLKDTRFAMYASFVAFWVIGLASSYLFAFKLGWQGEGVWLGLTLGVAVGAVMLYLKLSKRLRHVRVVYR